MHARSLALSAFLSLSFRSLAFGIIEFGMHINSGGVSLAFQRFTVALLYADSMNAKHALFSPFITWSPDSCRPLFNDTYASMMHSPTSVSFRGLISIFGKQYPSACICYVKQIKKTKRQRKRETEEERAVEGHESDISRSRVSNSKQK